MPFIARIVLFFGNHPWRLAMALLSLTFLTRFPVLFHYPFNIDEAYYAAGAARLVAGGAYYRDVVDHKPPGIYWIYAFVYQLAGLYNQRAIHLVLFGTVAATAWGLYYLGRRLFDRAASVVGSVLYVLASAVGPANDFQAANAELFMNLPLVWGLVQFTRAMDAESPRWSACFGAGVLAGASALIKPQGGAALLPMVLFLLLRPKMAWLAILAMGLGFFAILGLAGLTIGWQGAWPDFSCAMQFAGRYMGSLPLSLQVQNALLKYLLFAALNPGILFPCLVLWKRAGRQTVFPQAQVAWFCAGWILASIAAVGMGGRYYPHYFIQLIPPLALLAGRVFTRWQLPIDTRSFAWHRG